MLPNFIIIGAPKAGTTSLWALLRQHPDVFMCEPKEPAYFLYDERYECDRVWYESLFDDAGDAAAVGEATSEYCRTLTRPKALPRIATDVPGVRLIYMVRHPQDILISRWRQELFNANQMPRDFSQALRKSPELLENARFGHCLQVLDEYFPPENVLVLFFEEWSRRPAIMLRQVSAFLAIDDIWAEDTSVPRMNVGDSKDMDGALMRLLRRAPFADGLRRRIPPGMRGRLRKRMRKPVPPPPRWSAEDVAFLEEQIGDELSWFLRRLGRSEDEWTLEPGR